MEIDRYTATLQIPTRSWRLYKTGSLGELNYYQSELNQIGLPCFCQSISNINKIKVYEVNSVEIIENQLKFIYDDYQVNSKKEEQIIINLTDINNCVKGMIPLFELTVNFNSKKNKIEKKKSTLDYIEFYDLHSIINNSIFRFNGRNYQFDNDTNIDQKSNTAKEKWQDLENNLTTKISPEKVWSNFTSFAQGVIEFPEMLKEIESHIHLFRREETVWDEAFQLYSGLIFLQSKS